MSEQELGAVRRQFDELLLRHEHLKRHAEALEQAVAKARTLIYRDELTGLPNRRLLLNQFDQAVARAARQRKQVALLFLDLDGFQNINDALGHTTRDTLLRQVAARLVACIRTSDTACRLGGDEFVILLPDLESRESADVVAEKIRAHVATPYLVDGVAINMTTSIGMAVYPVDAQEWGDLMRRADSAMLCDKARIVRSHARDDVTGPPSERGRSELAEHTPRATR
jgi:diguanylate cyclase (GGDEF)-like protein